MTTLSSSSSVVHHHVEDLKSKGNDAFRQGNIQYAIQCYTSALECINDGTDSCGDRNDMLLLQSTLLSNRAMCQLKLAEIVTEATLSNQRSRQGTHPAEVKQTRLSLESCIDDCTAALARLDGMVASGSVVSGIKGEIDGSKITYNNDNTNNNLSARGKILYRRSKALVAMTSGIIADDDDDTKEKNLNAAARDLLQLLSFDSNNREATSLLRAVRYEHGRLGGGIGRSRISRSLDFLRSSVVNAGDHGGAGDASHDAASENFVSSGVGGGGMDALSCLRILQASLAEEVSSSAEDIGRRGGVPLLLQIAKCGIIVLPDPVSKKKEKHMEEQKEHNIPQQQNVGQCRVASLHVLSACCSHEPFVIRYAGRDSLPPRLLVQIVEEEAALSSIDNGFRGNGSADVTVAAMALLVRLIVHWELRESVRFFAPKILEDGSVDEGNAIDQKTKYDVLPEVDASSICRVTRAAFLWEDFSKSCSRSSGGISSSIFNDSRPPRAALDLLSTWTASDLDALDAASDACHAPTMSASSNTNSTSTSNKNTKKATRHRITPEEIRKMKPRQGATHRKREADHHRIAQQRTIRHISTFCSAQTGGLDAMLSCAALTNDHRLRRELGLQIGRLMSVYDETDDDEVKKLVHRGLGCTDWKVGKKDEDGKWTLPALTIEELTVDEEKEVDEHDKGPAAEMFAIMKRAQLTASLLLGKPEVGTWALKHGWSDGNGVEELKLLISSNDSRAMSIASEIASAASSVESARPLLATLVEEGTLEDLLIHPDADVRSGAASCMAKIGLASKSLSTDEGEVMELLDVAIELLFEEEEDDFKDETRPLAKHVPLSKVAESTSMDRGIEVLAYLLSKTFVKEKVASGYMPNGLFANRKPALQRLVEIACALRSSDSQIAYGLAGIFNLIAVSIETLRRETFIGKEITQEQYDQLQALGKTEEEKKASSKIVEKEGDDPALVRERIRKLANANVPRAMVKLLEGSSSDATQDKILEGMGRMASEPSVRGIMIQQGCLTTCLRLDKGDKPNDTEKKILRKARCCVAKLLITTNPGILTVSQRSGSVGPLLKLVKDIDALDLQHFEALMSLTNLAGFDDETKNRVVAQGGIHVLSYAMFSDHEMVRQAATEAMCNMVPHPEFMQYLTKEENIRVWVAFSMDYEINFGCARAAIGGLAMAVPDPEVANALVKSQKFGEMVRTLLECGQLQLMHRSLALIVGLIEHGEKCRGAIVASGVGPFCEAYLTSYSDEKKTMDDFNFSPEDRGSLAATLSLAKEVARLLQ